MDHNVVNLKISDRVYLPCVNAGIDIKEYLNKYTEREFPEGLDGENVVYSIPRSFQRNGEKQASLAEQVVFERLHGINKHGTLHGLWMIFLHNVSYGGHSNRNQRIGKLVIREHDFVLFVKFNGSYHIIFIEVKSTNDSNTTIDDISITSDAKVIKNNKRSAQHQLRDHSEILQQQFVNIEYIIQQYIFWPFLGAFTKDPKQITMRRWKDDDNLHIFEDVLSKQELFNEWFECNILKGETVDAFVFSTILNRYLALSCGVFINEINEGMLAILTQEQLDVLNTNICRYDGKPLVVHGAAGTGKTLLVLKKLQQLYEEGRLDENNKALYICYWPGIRCDFEQKIKHLGLTDYVDTARFYITQTGFLQRNLTKYKHIFMDESEAICLVFEDIVLKKTITTIYERYHDGNCQIDCKYKNIEIFENIQKHNCDNWGELWFLVDINQASLFLPKHSPKMLKTPKIVLTKVMRSTGCIFNVFKHFYTNPMPLLPSSLLAKINIPDVCIGHNILGPPICWVNLEKQANGLVNVIIDLCSTKGFKPNELCVIPFLTNDSHISDNINKEIDKYFVENGFRPKCINNVETFLCNRAINEFLVAWALRVKGLEFKVVVIIIGDEDFDITNGEDRRKAYIMASRCTCMLVLISSKQYKDEIDLEGCIKDYPFGIKL